MVLCSTLSDLCLQPLDGGPCRVRFPRWFYDDRSGQCTNFTYGGCRGNQNRFSSREACENSCQQARQLLQATRTCRQPVEQGEHCSATRPGLLAARWAFNETAHQCQPFYYAGCGGNTNNFDSMAACRQVANVTLLFVFTYSCRHARTRFRPS